MAGYLGDLLVAHLSSEIRVPFQIGPHGGVDYTTDPVIQAMQHIMSVVLTNPGERVMRPGYGVPVWDALFEGENTLVSTALIAEMRRAVNDWEPGIEIVNIRQEDMRPDDGLMQFFISFRLSGSTEVHEANVYVGGSVDERTLPR